MKELKMLYRPCGGCTKCCTLLAVAALGKPTHTPCEHLSDTANAGGPGCGIYKKRPQECSGFHCLWRMAPSLPEWSMGLLPPFPVELKPDKCGIVIQPEHSSNGIPAFCVYEEELGAALKNKPLMNWLNAAHELGLNIVFMPPKEEERIFIPGKGKEDSLASKVRTLAAGEPIPDGWMVIGKE